MQLVRARFPAGAECERLDGERVGGSYSGNDERKRWWKGEQRTGVGQQNILPQSGKTKQFGSVNWSNYSEFPSKEEFFLCKFLIGDCSLFLVDGKEIFRSMHAFLLFCVSWVLT